MSIGYDKEKNLVNLNDTAEISVAIYDDHDEQITSNILGVNFTIQKPDKTKVGPIIGHVENDGTGTLRWDGTDDVGQYLVVATFTTLQGKQSARADFEVTDPFKDDTPSPSWVIADAAWKKLEDCFDAEDEGPWLRDMTMNYFNKDKMEAFINEALFDINIQHPPTDLTIGAFAYENSGQTYATADLPLMAQAVFMAVLRHLMRSYVEQPNPVGAQIAWHDRRDYLQRWQSVYAIEEEHYKRFLALFKRRFLGLGHSRVLVSSKAGRLIPAPMRTRNVGRGYW